jgi:hypothetical protein
MSVDNYKTVPKTGVVEMINHAIKVDYIVSNPIEHYSLDEIKRLSELARCNDLLFSIKEERSNFYQGIMINLIKKSMLKESNMFINSL